MIDFMKLSFLLEEFGIPFEKNCDQKSWRILVGYNYPEGLFGAPEVDKNIHIDGYLGFYTKFEFTTDGKFVKMGAWE